MQVPVFVFSFFFGWYNLDGNLPTNGGFLFLLQLNSFRYSNLGWEMDLSASKEIYYV